MAGGKPPQDYHDFDPNNPYTAISVLAERVANLGKEKEAIEREQESLEKRIAKMEKTVNMGWGVVVIIPVIGSLVGFISMYAKFLFSPWNRP